MRKVKSLLFIIMLFVGVLSAQPPVSTYSTTNKKAIQFYEEALRSLDHKMDNVALDNLNKAIEKDPNFVEAHALKAELYGFNAKYDKAIEEYKISLDINPAFFPNNFYFVGHLELKLGRYEDAKVHFQKYLDSKSVDHKLDVDAERELKSCEFAIAAMKSPVTFNPQNVGPEINSANDEYFPSITADDQTFLFTRLMLVPQNKQYNGNDWQEDFFYSVRDAAGKWKPAKSMGTSINTETNEGAPSLSVDGQYLFFVVCEDIYGYGLERKGYGSCDIFVSKRNGEFWKKPNNVGPPVNTKNWETQPSFSSDGKTLYFVRGKVDENGVRNGDIYMVQIQNDGQWGTPVRLSDKINTDKDEESVFIHPDNQTLYFSSNGRPGMGGLDIYMSKRQANGEWGDPVNLGYPINTFNDENSLLVNASGKLAYFASNRTGGYGKLDIYSFELDQKFRPESMTYFKGKVFDAKTKKVLDAQFELIDLETGKIVTQSTSSAVDGTFLVCLPANKNYALNVSKPNYVFYSENFAMKDVKDISKPFLMDVPLQPIDTGSTVQLKNVFFETAKFDLKEQSKIELQKLVTFLNSSKTLKIELSGHTDNVGDKKANISLSQNRAKAVYDYLVANGIPADRLTYKGYGDTKPVAPNDTPENRQKNRRTEFKITAK